MKRKNKYDVGTIHKSNNFGDVEIICRVDNTKRVVKFLDTGYTKNYTLSAIDKGRMQDDTKVIGEFTVGSLHKTNMSGDVKIISFNNANDIEIEFMNTGNKSKCTKANLAKGLVRDELEYVYRGKYSEGSIHKTKFCGDVLVLKVLDDGKRLIQFMNTGNTKKITKHKLSTATDKEHLYHTTGKYRIGSVHKSNNCGNFEIIGRTDNNQERIIKFLNTGVETTTTISRIREGCVYDKSVLEYSLYYCRFAKDNKTLYKIGISSNLKVRWKDRTYKGWKTDIIILDSGSYQDMYDKEQEIIQDNAPFRDVHHEDFIGNGSTEMFYRDVLVEFIN